MGNTQLPQAGAAGTRNGRDTLSGPDQLTDQERKQRQQGGQGIGPSPSRPKNAPPRIPGQLRDPGKTGGNKRNRDDHVKQSARHGAEHPANRGAPVAHGGHARTGHSPADAS